MNLDAVSDSIRSSLTPAGTPLAWLVDVDDTLTDTRSMHHHAAAALTGDLRAYMSRSSAASVATRFREIFDELILTHQRGPGPGGKQDEPSADLEARIHDRQKDISAEWGVTRMFSREVLLRIAVEDCQASLSPAELGRCVDRYWQYMRENPIFFPDAIRFSRTLASHGGAVYLMTSSDARYRPQADGRFSYDPDDSRNDKEQRLRNFRGYGLEYSRAFIGDPVDKPSPEFFRQAFTGIAEDLERPLESFSIMAVGDSYRSDIKTPLSLLDSAIGILYRRGQAETKIEAERVMSIGDFDVISDILDSTEGVMRQ